MSKSSSFYALILALLLSACSTVPEPVPEPEVEAAPETVAAPAPEPEPEPEPVDFNQVAYQEAITSLKQGNVDQAIDLLLEVSREAPDKPYIFTNLGLAYFNNQQMDLAEQAFQKAIDMEDDDAVAHNHLGILQRHKGQFQDALQRYQRAIEIDRNYAGAHLNLGILFDIYLQDLEKALQQYETYLSLVSEEDKQVANWVVDIKRRIKSATNQSQG